MKDVLAGRVKKVREMLHNEGLSGAVFSSKANVTWLTGFRGDDSWVLLTMRKLYLLTDTRYTEQAGKETCGCEIYLRPSTMVNTVIDLIAKNKSVKAAAVESNFPYGSALEIQDKSGIHLTPCDKVFEQPRAIKDDYETSCIKKAASISNKALAGALEALAHGMTETEFTALLEYEMMMLGAHRAFETIACFGAGGSEPHHIPGKRKLRKNDCVLVDFGAAWDGYCSDITRSFAVGMASKKYCDAYEAVKNAQKAAIDIVAPGVSMADVDAASRAIIKASGFEVYGHGTGHSFGLEIHEAPYLSAKAKESFEPGQVLTIEPGIYIPGEFGIRIEDDILVTESGCRILTRSAKSPELEIVEL
ncbi:MAG: M24 family metallopeptidase [Hydrogenovibrio sp.]